MWEGLPILSPWPSSVSAGGLSLTALRPLPKQSGQVSISIKHKHLKYIYVVSIIRSFLVIVQ